MNHSLARFHLHLHNSFNGIAEMTVFDMHNTRNTTTPSLRNVCSHSAVHTV